MSNEHQPQLKDAYAQNVVKRVDGCITEHVPNNDKATSVLTASLAIIASFCFLFSSTSCKWWWEHDDRA
jgi:hypothetical protein